MHDEKKIVVSRQLGEYEKLLPENNFTRIHDKYIINLAYIKEYIKGSGGEVVLENGKEIPVATRRKEDFLARFDKWIRIQSCTKPLFFSPFLHWQKFQPLLSFKSL
jgi:two-component system LytT family response regulator